MRRVTATITVATLLILFVAGPADAARPAPPLATAVTITATGGVWPYCEQAATLTYTGGHARGTFVVEPYRDGVSINSFWAGRIRGSGTVDIAISGIDYSQVGWQQQPDGWFWLVRSGSRTSPLAHQSITSTYDFLGTCPSGGTVLATGPLPLPW